MYKRVADEGFVSEGSQGMSCPWEPGGRGGGGGQGDGPFHPDSRGEGRRPPRLGRRVFFSEMHFFL